ncbi:glycosyl hydrolase family 18 protein [Endozoicomonas acroporae]|uniref:glycosyl hydrolase family 18 protein n=1 Tax=Endozoicomonas acroporae TaxID=1701104 RepID=UPI001C60C310|nr:glycosyl hydrolase family 18 protein [Endozoicomonas acroporae]
MIRKTKLAFILGSMIASAAAQAALPPTPVLGWGDHKYALVEVSQSAVAYKELVTVNDEVNIEVSWDLPWGTAADTEAKILFDGDVQWTGTAGAKQASFPMSKGGKWDMTLQFCNGSGCSTSAPKPVVVADTDGAHLEALPVSWTEFHKPYENKTGKVMGTYFVEWSVYGRNYPFDKVPVQNLTHILYGFIPICSEQHNDSLKSIDGSWGALQNACAGTPEFEVVIHDPWAALQKGFSQEGASSWSDPYKGNYAAMMAAKKTNPDLKILPSIGGWTLSDPFHQFHDETNRRTFVNSVEKFLRTWKFFDGVDIDWEHPGGKGANPSLGNPETDGPLYVTLMKELRQMLDRLEAETGREYQLTSAMNAGKDKIDVVNYKQVSPYLDYLFAMTYDFYGAFNVTNLNHHTGLYESSMNDMGENRYFSHNGIQEYVKSGIDHDKIVLGVALYGRGWAGVSNLKEAGNPFSGTATGGINGTWEKGVLDYRDIYENHGEAQGFVYGYDQQAEAPYLWKESTGELITYDDPSSIQAKGQYVLDNNMAGLFSWEIDADNGMLTNAMHESLGHGEGTTEPGNRAPVARAGADQSVVGPVAVTLDGSSSFDPDRDAITYQWQQTVGDPLTLADATAETTTIVVPRVDAEKQYTFTLTVTDVEGLSNTDSVVITNKPEQLNTAPAVTISPTTYVDEQTLFTLTANARDADNDILTYSWSVPSVFTILSELENTLELKAPAVDASETHNIVVTVSDGDAQASATTVVHVENVAGVIPPGDCDVTDPNASNYPSWDAATIYTTETVSHKGLVYKAKWWVQGSEPSPSNEAWQLISDVELGWQSGIGYNGGAQVNHNGLRWEAKWWSKGDEPGVVDVWVNFGPSTCD